LKHQLKTAFLSLFITAQVILNPNILRSQCPTFTNSTFTTTCVAPGNPCNVCAYQTITLHATGTNLPNGGCVKWYYSQNSGFNPYNGEGTYIGCGTIMANNVANFNFETTEAMCNNGVYYVVGILDPLDLTNCFEPFTTEFSYNVICPIGTIDTMYRACNGSYLGLLSSGGTSYQWSGPAGFSSTMQNPILPPVTVNNSGIYFVTVTDNNGCKVVKSEEIIIYPPFTYIFDPYPFPHFCPGHSVTITAYPTPGGSGNTVILGWERPLFNFISPNNFIEANELGYWWYIIEDLISGCIEHVGLLVLENPPLQISISPPMPHVCPGGALALTASSANGVAPYTYLWNTAESSETITVSQPGTYEVTVTDSKGCTGSKSVIVEPGTPPMVSITPPTGVFCPNATILLTAQAMLGKPPYVFNWSTPAGAATGPQLNAGINGNYIVTVTDNIGCAGTASALINQNPDITISITPPIAIICNNGVIPLKATATGGSGGGYQYSWTTPTGTASGSLINANEAGVYTVTVTDGANCKNEASILVQTAAELLVDFIPDPAQICSGGSIDLTAHAIGGDGNYSYKWATPIGFFNKETITTAVTGLYYVTVTDGNGCSGKGVLDVKPKAAIQILFIPDTLSICSGDSVLLSAATNEPGPLNYAWSTPLGTLNVDSITVTKGGMYSLTVTNAKGCIGVDSINVKEDPGPGILISPDPAIFCAGGSVQLSVSSTDTSVLSYNWSTPSGTKTGNVINANVEGNYIILLSNANGCSNTDSIYVSQSPDLSVSILPDPASFCPGSSVQLSASSTGSGTFTYTWSTPKGTETGSMINATVAGNYIVTVSNAIGCTGTDAISVTQNDTLDIIISPDPASFCSGQSVILTAASTSSGMLSFNWITPTGVQSGNVIAATAAGTYAVTVTNSSGCSGETSINVTLLSGIAVDISPPNPGFCIGKSIDLTANAIGSNLSFAWSTPSGNVNGQTINAAISGAYSVTVTDDGGCTGTASVQLDEYPGLDIVIDPNPASFCNSGSVTLTAINNNGVAPFIYQWNTPGASGSSQTYSANIIGFYSVTVTDVNGCSGSASTQVSQSNSLTVSILPAVPAFCPGKSVDISVKANGGQVPYAYTWNTPIGVNSSSSITTSTAGSYQVTATDSNGCSGQAAVTVNAYDAPLVILPASFGFCSATDVSIQAIVEDILTPLIYNWSTPTGTSNNAIIVASTAGDYYLTVTNAGACSSFASTTVEQWPLPLIQFSPDQPQFCKGSFLDISASSNIGQLPFSYNWQGPAGSATTNPLNISVTGNYALTLTDAHGCSANASLNATELPGLVVNLSTDPLLLCSAPYTILSQTSGGVLPYSYNWITPTSTQTSANVTANDFGMYTLTVTDTKACSGTSSITTQDESPIVELDKTDPGCIALKSGSITLLSTVSPDFPLHLVLNNEPPVTINSLPYVLSALPAGSYQLVLTASNGCQKSFSLDLSSPSIPELQLGDDVSIFQGESYTIHPSSNFTIDSISWTNKSSLVCTPGCIEPIATPPFSTTYKATAYSKDGCRAIDDINIYVTEKESVYVPNSFSPNGDGINDQWIIFTDQTVKQIKKMYIYDRWGESILIQENFPANDPSYGWDGKFRKQILNEGVFVYYFVVEFNDGRTKEYKGDVNLLR